jgi:ABC-type tungstate transport system permease subunit
MQHKIPLGCRRAFGVFIAVMMVSGCPGSITGLFSQEYRQILVATGSPYELGLVDELAKAFQNRYGGVVRGVKTPTGPGLDLGRQGLVHIVIGHEKEAAGRFVREGHAAKKAELMHNTTIVVGPRTDPAGIAGLKDLVEVRGKIYRAASPYLSRGDGGGMHRLEQKIWKDLGLNPEKAVWYRRAKHSCWTHCASRKLKAAIICSIPRHGPCINRVSQT